MFKARNAPKQTRKKVEDDGEGGGKDGEGTGDQTAAKLSAVRELQREHWHRHRGVVPAPNVSTKEEEEKEEEEQFGLDTGFAGASGQKKEDPHLEAFINSRLETEEDKVVEEVKREKTREERLYEIPTELQVVDNQSGSADKMSWQAGLSEVSLGVEFKLANIEATEQAKRLYLHGESGQKRAVLEPDAVTRKAFGSRFQHFDDGASTKTATDSAVVDRFRKRMRQ